jgi:hypothetical protein
MWRGIGLYSEDEPPDAKVSDKTQQVARAKQSKQFETEIRYSSLRENKNSVNAETGLRTVSANPNCFGNSDNTHESGDVNVTKDVAGGGFVTSGGNRNSVSAPQVVSKHTHSNIDNKPFSTQPDPAAGDARGDMSKSVGPNAQLFEERRPDFEGECHHGTPGGCWLCNRPR